MAADSPVLLSEHQKNAYRYLLYRAMLDIRPMQWSLMYLDFFRPRKWRHLIQDVRTNAALACWLHNMAQLASLDFREFDEDRFWDDGRHLARRDAKLFERYQQHYARRLQELESGTD